MTRSLFVSRRAGLSANVRRGDGSFFVAESPLVLTFGATAGSYARDDAGRYLALTFAQPGHYVVTLAGKVHRVRVAKLVNASQGGRAATDQEATVTKLATWADLDAHLR